MKKRLICLLCAAVIILAVTPAAAAAPKPGTVAGYYYYTDIVTYLWGVPVNSINIGGRTLIDAESMAHYGFTVTWLPKARQLTITDDNTRKPDYTAASGTLLDMASGKMGSVAGKYYYTDIVTTLNGQVIKSYNIGGRTFIWSEGLRNFGYTVDWDGTARMLSISAAPLPAVCTPWSYAIETGGEPVGQEDLQYIWFAAERNTSAPEVFDITSGSGFPALSNIVLQRDQWGQLSVFFSIYQNTGMPVTEMLRGKLYAVASYAYDGYTRDPASAYDALNSLLQVYISGARVMISELKLGGGNGHSDYWLMLDTDGSLEESGVTSAAMLLNTPADLDVTLSPPAA